MIASLIILAALVLVGSVLYFLDKRQPAPEAQQPAAPGAQQAPGELQPAAPSAQAKQSPSSAVLPPGAPISAPAEDADEACCGMHITCEKDSLLAAVSSEIVYYDDEELDAYRGRRPDQYADGEIEQFRDVLLTLLPSDIAGWGRSLQLRGINLPLPVRDELIMIVAEARQEQAAHQA